MFVSEYYNFTNIKLELINNYIVLFHRTRIMKEFNKKFKKHNHNVWCYNFTM
jgi:hypothetical protein